MESTVSLKERNLKQIEKQIRRIHQKELQSEGFLRSWNRTVRWILMLYHEVVRDDVPIRAQSLSYFTLFSILPLMAGVFLLLNFFSQWGPVQTQFQGLLVNVLEPIPDDYRDTLMDFILQFKDEYIAKISKMSGTIGVFALGVLIWIVAKVFFNIEDTMNRIWAAVENRTWLERTRSFVICTVVVPFCIVVAVSLPGLISHFAGGRVSFFLADGLPMLLEFLGMSFLFRYFPNVRVLWKSAFWGAGFSATLILLANFGLKIYFRFGTETAYGKMAILPIVAFFIYVFWMIFILGAEVSFLMQNRSLFIGRQLPKSTLGEAMLLEQILERLHDQFGLAEAPQSEVELASHFDVPSDVIAKILRFLCDHHVVAEVRGRRPNGPSTYVVVKAKDTYSLGRLIKDYLDIDVLAQNFDVSATVRAIQSK